MGLILKSLCFSVDCGFESVNRTIFVVNGGKNSLESSAWYFADTLCPFLKKVYKRSNMALTLRPYKVRVSSLQIKRFCRK